MITQVWQTFSDYNQTGAAATLAYTSHNVPFFIPLVLFCFYIIIVITSYYFSRKVGDRGNFFASMAVAGYLTTIVAFSMTLIEGLINSTTLITTVVIAVIGTLLLLIQER